MAFFYDNPILNESIIFSKEDKYINFDKWENGENNILFITGLSGSGKSTLGWTIAAEYDVKYISLDELEDRLVEIHGCDKLRNMSDVEYYSFFADEILKETKSNKCVVEGVHLLMYHPDDVFKITDSMIIKNTSYLKSNIRGILRDFKDWKFKSFDIFKYNMDFETLKRRLLKYLI